MKCSVRKTLGELGELFGARISGDPGLVITGLAGLAAARDGDLSYVLEEKNLAALGESRAAAFIVPQGMVLPDRPSVQVADVRAAVEQAKAIFRPPLRLPVGIHPSAVIGEDVTLGSDVTILAHVVIQDGARVGDRTVIYPGVYVGHRSVIGSDCLIYPNVVIREDVEVGDRAIIHAGAVLGADGFGFEQGAVPHRKIAQIGRVVIGDDVEIGANTTIDRAALDATVIGRGTKLDNLVQVAHNVQIGDDCLLSSQTGIAGSTAIGSNVILGGQVGVGDHVRIGDQVVVAAKSGVTKSVGPRQVLYGNPAGDRIVKQREAVSLRKIPELWKLVKDLVKRVSRLEDKFGWSDTTEEK
ncbi:MAG: UDP-3-O-(3-hydroxymyristoyl)glucosamine N-acyltransferase [Planctomycetota bacterium]